MLYLYYDVFYCFAIKKFIQIVLSKRLVSSRSGPACGSEGGEREGMAFGHFL